MSTPQQPKALLFSHICNPDHITGAEKMLLFMTLELGRHYACTLVVPGEGLLAVEARNHGIHTVVQSFPLLYEMYHPSAALPQLFQELLVHSELPGLLDLLLIHEPEIVFTNTCVNILPAVAAKRLGIPVTWVIAETILMNEFTHFSVELMDQYADWIVGISGTTMQPLQSIMRSNKKFVIPPSWHSEHYNPSDWPIRRQSKRAEIGIYDERPVIGYISSDIYANKGLDHFIQMGINICETNRLAHFMITGKPVDPVYMESCIQMIMISGYSSQFSFLPFDANIQSIYPAMDIVVIPSLLNEGFGLTALEGHIFGKAVVAYRSGGLEEILNSTGNEAFLAHKGDVQDLTSKIQYLLSDHQNRQNIGIRNSQAIHQVFGIEAYRGRLGRLITLLGPVLVARRSVRQKVLKFPEHFLLKGESSHTVFVIEHGLKRPISTGADFNFYKYDWNRVGTVGDHQLAMHPTGTPIRAQEPFLKYAPAIYVAKGQGPTVYLMQHGVRYPFMSESALQRYGYAISQVVMLPESGIASYTPGLPIGGNKKAAQKGPSRRKSKAKLIMKKKTRKATKLRKGAKLRKGTRRFAKGGFKARKRKVTQAKKSIRGRGQARRRVKKVTARHRLKYKSIKKVGGKR
ncbi:glycosyltransferase [Paenibacillus alginolyticus]|uniref:Glycosyltransferase n=2 Tax=Paenibacillus alginolyticus TaxID=59839 RepID=A0ABT4GDW7_9BACL|nr:glycosyltransferase [Paenibacillus alginolyticus]MCY9694381.1 glycosyltransferase [Paenibacillus alginolyticus]